MHVVNQWFILGIAAKKAAEKVKQYQI